MRAFSVCLALSTLSAADWPSFRGPSASGTAGSQNLPDSWDGPARKNIRWKTPIPGLAHSSPIVWGDRIFVTSAVSSRAGATFKPGLYGEGTASEDNSVHRWIVLCLDRKTGQVLWERTAYEGVPKEKRHIKSTYASATPATNGQIVVALFGSQGLYAYDLDGKLLWKKDLGRINAGAYDLPEYEWGTASSPIIYKDLVIVQVDQQKGSFLLAVNAKTGDTVWRAERDELPSWASPTVVVTAGGKAELVTNAPNAVRAYDPLTGRELWKHGGSSKITAPTPVFTEDLIIVASGRRPEAPIFAIRPGGQLLWRKDQRGSYMPTPLLYQGLLYVLGNGGVLDCYEPQSGAEVYRGRIPHQGSGFSGSPVAADSRIYLPSEDGDIFTVEVGRTFKLLGKNPMGEPLMATPAFANGLLIVRTQFHLWAVGR